MKNIKLKISKMSCAACSASIERSLKRKDFIKSIEVDLISECANVAFDESRTDIKTIIALIKKLGYGAEIFSQKATQKAQNSDYLIAIIFAIPLFCVSMGAMIWSDSLTTNQTLICAIEIALLLPILYAGRKIYAKGFNALIKFVPNMDSLVFLGSGSAIAFSAYMVARLGFESPHLLHNLYFESAGVIIAVIMLGKRLENLATSNAKSGIESLINLAPKTALKVQGKSGETLEVRVESLQIGDILAVPKGAAFGVDCELLGESCEVDESVISGESKHKRKAKGDLIYSGSVNCGEMVRVRVKNVASDSMISKIIALAQNVKKAPIARIADTISAYFVPCVIAVALCAGIAWGVASGDFHKAFIVFSSTLLISCPCALGLATPLSIMVATSIAAKRAFYFKNAESLEVCAKITTMIFDKTGTLTSGDLRVVEWIDSRQSSANKSDIFSLIYAIESQSEHLIAKAILRYIRESSANLGVDLSEKIAEVQTIAEIQTITGKGISGHINDRRVKIGTADFVGETHNGKSCAIDSHLLAKSTQIPHTTCFVSVDSQCVGFFVIADDLRPNAKNLVANLRAQGIKSIILSGDNAKSVQSVANLCAIDEFYHSQLPQDKLDFITRVQERGEIVGFVGDGINDALAITRANIGVALNSASDIAIKQSDIILLNGDLGSIAEAIALSRRTIRNIKENLGFAFVYNVCAIPLAVGIPQILGFNIALNPMVAGVAMGLSSISVVMNALRLEARCLVADFAGFCALKRSMNH
ncbi:heavy metal translocating P-type ATPase [Helicobacter sp. 23-1045]